MLIVISDLHFVDETAGKHNLPYGAFENVFLSDIAALVKDKNDIKEVKILLLGDIVDLLRSEQWFDIEESDRPWGANGLKDIPNPQKGSATERKCMEILGQAADSDLSSQIQPASLNRKTILYHNWDTFKLFREFKSRLKEKSGKDINVEIIYTPGNHDRLCNLYPSVRDTFKKNLGLTINMDTATGDLSKGDWKYRCDFIDENYAVYAQHGHKFDKDNYAEDQDKAEVRSLQVPIGDVMTTEFAVKIPYKLESLRKDFPDIKKEDFDELVEHAKDIDNIRPLNKVVEWMHYRITSENDARASEALDRAFKLVVKEFLDIDFVRKSETYRNRVLRIASSSWISGLTKTLVDWFGAETALPVIMGMSDEPTDPQKSPLAIAAYNEPIWRNNEKIQFILYGHTHAPLQMPLDSKDGKEVIYLNTGTWRNRIIKTIELNQPPDFIELKAMTYGIFYRRDEDTGGKKPGTVSFDVWTGAKKKLYL